MTEIKIWGRTLEEWGKDGFVKKDGFPKYDNASTIANEGGKLKRVKKGGAKEDYKSPSSPKKKQVPTKFRGRVRPATLYVVLHWTGIPRKYDKEKDWAIWGNYVLGRDGTIYTGWHHDISAGHCSGTSTQTGSGGDYFFSKFGVGIEMVNIGHFKRVGKAADKKYRDRADKLYDWIPAKTKGLEAAHTHSGGAEKEKYFVRIVANPWEGHAGNPLKAKKNQPLADFMAEFEDPGGDPDAQYAGMIYLVKALCESYSIPKKFLQFPWMHGVGKGDPDYEMLKWAFRGIVGHTNVQNNKVDPGPCLDYFRLMRGITDLWYFPIDLAPQKDKATGKPMARDLSLTAKREHFWDAAELPKFYARCESGTDGFFPVGKFNVWHNGIHLKVEPGQPVYCGASGWIVAARLGDDLDLFGGKTSARFVLVRHKVQYKVKRFFADGKKYVRTTKKTTVYLKSDKTDTVPGLSPTPAGTPYEDLGASGERQKVKSLEGIEGFIPKGTFAEVEDAEMKGTWITDYSQPAIDVYSLYMHLAKPDDFEAAKYGKEPKWLYRLKPEELDKLKGGEVVILDRPVFAGDLLGYAGKFDGRDVLHWEVFSPEEIAEGVYEDTRMAVKDGDADNVMCDFEKLKQFILDTTGDKVFSEVEIKNAVARMRRMKAYHKSEWAAESPDEFPEPIKERLSRDGKALWNEGKKLTFWPKIAEAKEVGIGEAGGKAKKGIVWFYHPLTFMSFINERADRIIAPVSGGDEDEEPVGATGIEGAYWSTPAGERLEGPELTVVVGTKVGLTAKLSGLDEGTEVDFYVMDRDWDRDEYDDASPEELEERGFPGPGDDFVQKVSKPVTEVDKESGKASVTAEWEIVDSEWGSDEVYFIAVVASDKAVTLAGFEDELEPGLVLSDNELLVPEPAT